MVEKKLNRNLLIDSGELRVNAHVALIQTPDVDFDSLIAVAHQALGYNPASKADGDSRDLSISERYLSCLASLRDRDAPVGLLNGLLKHVSFSVLFGADERDMRDILECCSAMPSVSVDSVFRGTMLSVVTGTLVDWRDAVIAGVAKENNPRVRSYFCEVQTIFESIGIAVWKDYHKKYTGRLYFLEHRV